jgi:predicted nucleic acid-binding protein
MTDYYLDSSAILKHYHTEPGTDLVDAMFDSVAESPIYTAFFSILEVRAAATRLNRGGTITNRGLRILRDRLLVDTELSLTLVALTDALLVSAVSFAEGYALSAGDAVQLAAALEANRLSVVQDLIFVTADRQLLEAAVLEGFSVLDPAIV